MAVSDALATMAGRSKEVEDEIQRHETDVKQAARQADSAEADAEFAIAHAIAAIEEAEYAALDAVLTRKAADELTAGG